VKGQRYIFAKQFAWAKRHKINLIGSQITRGRLAYTPTIDQNLFLPLSTEVKTALRSGDGDELGSGDKPGKIQAIHSSSALGTNIFQYWSSVSAAPVIAAACRFCRAGSEVSQSIRFEEKYPIDDSFSKHPNIDVCHLQVEGLSRQTA